MPPLRTDLSDGALIERTRRGDRAAYGELWQRHSASARTVARSYSSLDPDDLVAESFTRIYDAILAGRGPTGAFRPYLFTTIRNTAASWGRARRETNLETLESFEDPSTSESATLDALDRSTTAQAFRSLPTRWQEVLWYSEVEGMAPQQIAPLIGMSANATAALAYRAREGLRQAWIQAHLRNADNEPECRWTIDRLGGYTRGRLRGRDTARLEAHLDDCARCTIVAAEAREVGSRLALVLLPLAAGIGGATAYSAWLSQGAPAVNVALGAAGLPAVLAGTAAAHGAGAGGRCARRGRGAGAVRGRRAGRARPARARRRARPAASARAGSRSVRAPAPWPWPPPRWPPSSSCRASRRRTRRRRPPRSSPRPIRMPARSCRAAADALRAGAADPGAAARRAERTRSTRRPTTSRATTALPAPPPAPAVPRPRRPRRRRPTPDADPTPEPEPEPVDDLALPPVFAADSAGGLVDPILSGSAEPGAAIVVTADDGSDVERDGRRIRGLEPRRRRTPGGRHAAHRLADGCRRQRVGAERARRRRAREPDPRAAPERHPRRARHVQPECRAPPCRC